MTGKLLTARQAAEHIGVPESYLRALRRDGDGPVFVKLGRHVRYDAEDLDAFVQTRKRRSTRDGGAGAPPVDVDAMIRPAREARAARLAAVAAAKT